MFEFESLKSHFDRQKRKQNAELKKILPKSVLDNIYFVKFEPENLELNPRVVPILISSNNKEFVDLLTNKVYPVVLIDSASCVSEDAIDAVEYDAESKGRFDAGKYKFYSKFNGKEIFLRNYSYPIYESGLRKDKVSEHESVVYYYVAKYEAIPLGQRGIDYNKIGDINEWRKWENCFEYVDFSELMADYYVDTKRISFSGFRPERGELLTAFERNLFKVDKDKASLRDVYRVADLSKQSLIRRRQEALKCYRMKAYEDEDTTNKEINVEQLSKF